ncbi:hypothetical protein SAMN05421670_3455 [Psychrobacillus psychrotolerans]|uniref:YusW-like protein n=1 Tax=Psychrobacillus psychrotolerans TaxID=126156 RepID=A0A1I6ALX3_9BACI|nr:hypothetical protein [Psychrobacillus psychrotolerans]SFQ69630.1 hypothetical protein SAMN05421670_3455 [Psychrobacillus psychrotolerans]
MKLLKKTSMAILVMLTVIVLSACAEKETPKEATPKESMSAGEKLVNIMNYELSTKLLTLDEVEWIDESDTDRIKELGLDVEKDLPTSFAVNGFAIYNENMEEVSIKLADDAELFLVNQENPLEPRAVDEKEFITYLLGVKGPYNVTVKDDEVVRVEEKYMP